MVTVRQLLELMYYDDSIEIMRDDESDISDYFGDVALCESELPNAVLDCAITHIYTSYDKLIVYREVRK